LFVYLPIHKKSKTNQNQISTATATATATPDYDDDDDDDEDGGMKVSEVIQVICFHGGGFRVAFLVLDDFVCYSR